MRAPTAPYLVEALFVFLQEIEGKIVTHVRGRAWKPQEDRRARTTMPGPSGQYKSHKLEEDCRRTSNAASLHAKPFL